MARYYARSMDAASLPARIAYGAIALPLGGALGFYASMRLFPELTASHPDLDPNMDGFVIFKIAICLGVAIAFTASLLALTLPWVRHRKRRGRTWRLILTGAFVVFASVVFADQGFRLIYDLAFAAWLAYTMAFTFVRYGIIDQARRSSASAADY